MKIAISLVIALAAAMGIIQNAQAKTPAYVITGGELGPYAYHFFLGPGEESNFVDPVVAEAPRPLPTLAYDLYSSWGNFVVPFQLADCGPELRYYPGAGLLNRRGDGVWMKVTEAGAAILERAITEALAKKAGGELEASPVAADFRVRHLDVARYSLYSHTGGDLNATPVYPLPRSRLLGGIGGPKSEILVMEELVAMVSKEPITSRQAAPDMLISYWSRAGDTGYGGILGSYSFPSTGLPGRFWPEDQNFYSDAGRYYETTPGFDAMIAEAIQSAARDNTTTEETESNLSGGNVVAAAGAGAVLAGGLLLLVRKRRRDGQG